MNEMNEVRKPPVATTGIIGWLRINLFFNWTNSLITLFVIYCLYQFIPWILDWTIFSAENIVQSKIQGINLSLIHI